MPHNITTNILKMMPYTCLLLVPDVATQVQGIIFYYCSYVGVPSKYDI